MKSLENFVSPSSDYYNYSSSVMAKESLLYLLSIGHFIYEPGYGVSRDSFDSFLLAVILDGEVDIEIGNDVYRARQDDAVLIDCYRPHCYHTKTGCSALWLHFDGIAARGYYDMIRMTGSGCIYTPCHVCKIARAIHNIYEMFNCTKAPNEPLIALNITKALTAMLERTGPPDSGGGNTEVFDEMIYYINEHLGDDLTVKDLARKASFSEYHFIRIFHEKVGMTPRRYVIRVRIDHAKYLLKTTGQSIKEIGCTVGYKSAGMFCSAFKKYQGVTPSEYRNSAETVRQK